MDSPGKPSTPFAAASKFNIVRHRGDPMQAVTLSGHTVTKQEYVYYRSEGDFAGIEAGQWITMKCADYHGEHFVYIDPLYNVDGPEGAGHWFAMCTCGSPAVVVWPGVGRDQDSGIGVPLLVCYMYTKTLDATGFGRHVTTGERPWYQGR